MSIKEKIPFYDSLVIPYHVGKAAFWGTRYGFPGRKLKVIGVTGTNGKTTTSFMIWKMLNDSGRKAGVMTTVGWGVGEIHEQMEHMTTVDSNILNKRIKKIVDAGAEYLVLELTSHAMAQHRSLGIPIDVAVMTNVTHEHLDYHKTFERYRDAKRKLFKQAKYGIINADDPSAEYFESDVDKYVTYGVQYGEMKAENIKLKPDGVEYIIPSENDLKIKTQIAGIFNVYNSLACVAVGKRLGLSDSEIKDGIFALTEVEGRMVKIDEGQSFTAIMDYAHTPQIAEGAREHGKKDDKDLFKILDRPTAILEACKMAKRGDTVLFLGKGNEKTIERADGVHAYYELDEIKKALKKIKKNK